MVGGEALLPTRGTALASHDGLSYGGFIVDERMKTPLMIRVFAAALAFIQEQGFSTLRYKALPHIYAHLPAQEDLYALFLSDARVSDPPAGAAQAAGPSAAVGVVPV